MKISADKSKSLSSLNVKTDEISYFSRYGNLIQSITITSLDVIFLLGSVFSRVPKIITNTAFSFLNFTGLLAWSFYADQTKKNIQDAIFSFQKKNYPMALISCLKTIFVVSSLGLTILYCLAAAFRSIDHIAAMKAIYTFLRPIALPMLGLTIALDMINYLIVKIVLANKLQDDELSLFFKSFHSKSVINNKTDLHASYVRGCMDKDTWKHFISHCHKGYNKKRYEDFYRRVVISNIATQQSVSVSNLMLRALGEIGMYISIIYPGTAVQACIWTFLSGLYTIQLSYQHFIQIKQRKTSSEIASN